MRKRIGLILLAMSTQLAWAQDLTQRSIATIAQSDPLIMTGVIGTQNTYYHSSMGSGFRSPWANSLYANMNLSLYGISMPFSFYYSNDNSSFNFPHFSFHIDPTYKNWRAHFGRSNMPMHAFIMNMSFNGVGLEYTGRRLRFGAFYGELRNAVNDDPSDPKARHPQYRRLGWGFKVGYGSQRTFLDLYLLRAYDRQNSIDERWQERVHPQENLAIALKGGLGLTRWLSLRGSLAWSAFTSDTRSDRISSRQVDRWRDVFSARYSSLMRLATDVSANVQLPNMSLQLSYRMVQPDYKTLGLYYVNNNYQSLGVNLSTTLFRKVSLSANFSGQEDNITRNQLYTTRGFVYALNASTSVGRHLTLSAGYNGYRQVQSDGKARVNDTTRVNRVMHSFYFTPSYSLEGENLSHVFSLTGNYTENKDLNRFATGQTDVKTIAAGMSHNMDVKPWEMSFTTSLSYQQSKGYNTRYTSEVLSLTAGRSFLKKKNLSASATMMACLNDVQNQQRMLSMGIELMAGYTLNKVHVFNFSACFNKYSDTNVSADNSSFRSTELTMSLGYTYTFSLIEIKRNAEKKKNSDIERL